MPIRAPAVRASSAVNCACALMPRSLAASLGGGAFDAHAED
jgi:hypothetical protein